MINGLNLGVIAPLLIDSYKLGHMSQYPEGTEKVYCNFTPRSFKHLLSLVPQPEDGYEFFNNKAVVYGVMITVQEMKILWDNSFFSKDKDTILSELKIAIRPFIGDNDDSQFLKLFGNLHDLGYLPLEIKALDEGEMVNAGIPIFTITNTDPLFPWLPNYIETYLSSSVWKLSTAATIAKIYKRIFKYYAIKTGADENFINFQGHDFSSRGLSCPSDFIRTGTAHLTSFMGSDSVASTYYLRQFYDTSDMPVIGCSIPATEHSVMCMGGQETEVDTYKRLLTQYPSGGISIVSDTWDYWHIIDKVVPSDEIKSLIENRTSDSNGLGKTVFRPDSGDPVDIICGTSKYTYKSPETVSSMKPEEKGTIECLWQTFGGTLTDSSFRRLNPRVGAIYGDSITPNRAVKMLKSLMLKQFSSDNIVLGIGSFTYQYLTRDTLGYAMKATYGVINGVSVDVQKTPKTDSGKNSARGLLVVKKLGSDYVLLESQETDDGGELKTIFKDGLVTQTKFSDVKARLDMY